MASLAVQVNPNTLFNDAFPERRHDLVKKRKYNKPDKYEIKVGRHLGMKWFDWFDDITVENDSGITTITVDVLDQEALHGLLARIRDLGLPLILVRRD